MHAYNLFVSGRVQGVGYRWFAEREAKGRPIAGYVRNLSDGRVELFVQGSPEELDLFCDCLRSGPPGARVEHLDILAALPDRSLTSFSVIA